MLVEIAKYKLSNKINRTQNKASFTTREPYVYVHNQFGMLTIKDEGKNVGYKIKLSLDLIDDIIEKRQRNKIFFDDAKEADNG